MEDNREYRIVIIDSANAIFNDSNIYSFYVNLMQPLRDVYKIKILHAAVSIANSNMGPGHPINNLDPIYIDLNNYNRTTGAINTANGINYVSYYDSIIIDTNKIYPTAIASDYTTMFNNFNENEGAFHSVKKGAVFIDNTTASAKIARELFIAAKEKGFGFLDAPVSGGQAGAENGQLTVMIGGEDKDFEKAQDIIKCYSKKMKKTKINSFAVLAFVVTFIFTTFNANANQTRENVIKRGSLNCGVSQGVPGFSNADASGKWAGIDVDLCRAVAAAVLGDANKVKYSPLSAKDRFEVLKAGDIDVLARNTTWTLSRDGGLAVDFVGTNFYDGQGFMIRKAANINSAKKLNNVKVCVETGTTTELNLRDYFKQQKLKYEPVAFTKADEAVAAYDAGRCDVYTTDKSGLAANRTKLKNPADHLILPETISKEPLGPVVRGNDENWANIVRWTLNVMIEAEEYGITQANIDSLKSTEDPAIKRLLGLEGETGKNLSLANTWSYNIIKQVGNYAESYNANVGPKTPVGLARGQNASWRNGGLLYSPPVR